MIDRDSTLTIVVGGQSFGGWKEVRVTRGIERAAGDFDIGCTQRWPGQDARFEIAEGSSCEVWIGSDKVLTGYVDAIDTEYDADNAACRIVGRSKTCDLVDCSPNFDQLEYAGLDLAAVARKICAPFGIDVVASDTGPVYAVAAAHHGETAWKLIERLARQRKMLVMDDEQGRLVLAQLANQRADDVLVFPSDGLKRLQTKRDSSKRFSEYVVKAQAGARWLGAGTSDGTDPSIPSTLAHVEGAFYDRGVTRYRPKTVLSTGAAKKEGVLARAEWEARRAIGKALRVGATRPEWRQASSGALWRPNLLLPVTVPHANVDEQLAIAEVHYILNDQAGLVTELELAPPDAFTPEPPDAPGGGDQTGRWAGMGNTIAENP
jgi:prophage tail gpP-like protein